MAWYRCGGGGIPSSLKGDMNDVFNKKFGTILQDYPPEDWPGTVNLMGPLPEKTVSGSVVAFSDGADAVKLKSCAVTIAPNLDGVSSVDVVKGGKNLAPVNDFTAQRQTVMTFDTPLPAGIYSYSYLATRTGSDSRNGGFRFVYNDDTYLNEYIYVNEGTRRRRDGVVFAKPVKSIYVYSISGSYADSGNFTVTVDDFQIEFGSTATAYEPYVEPTTHTANLGRTIYGGEVDVVNGTGTDENAKTTLDDTGWTYYQTGGKNTFNKVISGALAGGAGFLAGYTWEQVAYIANQSNKCFYFYTSNTGVRISIRDDDYTSLEAWQSHINGMDLVYPKTPETFTFTPVPIISRLGDNTLWGDGDLSVTYRRDIDLALAQ